VLTDGASNNPTTTAIAVDAIHAAKDITMLSVGIGSGTIPSYYATELRRIASEQSTSNCSVVFFN